MAKKNNPLPKTNKQSNTGQYIPKSTNLSREGAESTRGSRTSTRPKKDN
ncbi:hypothetical protein [Wenyingzhuangia sp. IMCC45467]